MIDWLKIFEKFFFYDKWNIGHSVQSPENLIETQQLTDEITWLCEDRTDYKADPFIINIYDRLHLFYEELKYWKGKGQIIVADGLQCKNKKKVKGISEQNIHLSYPNVFESNGKVYCIPETSQMQQIALYEVDKNKPYIFKKIKILKEGGAFVDSSIIYYQGKYWLFTSLSGKYGELHIFYADTLLDEFKAHKLNPIVVGYNESRSAGTLFIVNHQLYMPTQNPGKCYGGSIMINKITLLSESAFQCQNCFEIKPKAPYNEGVHTINFVGNLIVVDGKRRIFSLLTPIKKVVKKVKNIF
ncbi:MAG: hypothetical protein JWP67_1252 [Mucilaginibacter sp.]|nr:hypothetical protein [Mucilaginibacter sp.]